MTGEIVPPTSYGYFPTPATLAERVVQRAEIQPGMLVLEPSAGQGALAEPAARIAGLSNVHCHELLDANCEVLAAKGFPVQRGDFLTVTPQPVYHRIAMNPPFERQQDIDHVLHAWACLAPGGRLVSIVSAGAMFRENRKTVIEQQLQGKATTPHGTIRSLLRKNSGLFLRVQRDGLKGVEKYWPGHWRPLEP